MSRAFEFLHLPPRLNKPRRNGLTMLIDSGLSINQMQEIIFNFSDYIDVWKLGWATTQLQDKYTVIQKVDLLRRYDIRAMTGGTLFELAEHQGMTGVYIDALVEYGFNTLELSSGSIDISEKRICEIVNKAKEKKLFCYCEVGKKEAAIDLSADEYNEIIGKYLNAGADKVIVEARESGKSVGVMGEDGEPCQEKLEKCIKGFDREKIIFEAPLKNQQVFFLKKFGSEVNLGNISPMDIVSLETLRRGLRGDTIDDFNSIIARRNLANQKS